MKPACAGRPTATTIECAYNHLGRFKK